MDVREARQEVGEMRGVGRLEEGQEQLHGLLRPLGGTAPSGLEPEPPELGHPPEPIGLSLLAAQQVDGLTKGRAERVGRVDLVREHERLIAEMVHPEEVDESARAVPPVALTGRVEPSPPLFEEAHGQIAVQVLHPAPDGARLGETWEAPRERLEIDLDHEPVLAALPGHQSFLHVEEVRDRHLRAAATDVAPASDPLPDREMEQGVAHDHFLDLFDQLVELGGVEISPRRGGPERLVLVSDFDAGQEGLGPGSEPAQEDVQRLPVPGDEVGQDAGHASGSGSARISPKKS